MLPIGDRDHRVFESLDTVAYEVPGYACGHPSGRGRHARIKTALIWTCFEGSRSVMGEYICQEIVDGGKICGAKIHPGGSTTPLWNHHKGNHRPKYPGS